ncbi:MAG: arylsulfatase [Bacteroidota bacterium]
MKLVLPVVKFYVILSLVFCLTIGCVQENKDQSPEAEHPNIVLILVDDMGFSDLGCYGSEINTPNLDKLAQQGIRFTRFYNTSKCFPSRATLLTGLYPEEAGMLEGPGHFSDNCVTIAEVLKEAGYRTLMTGKHHGLDNPVDFGFDRYYGLRDGASNHFNPGQQREGEGVPAHKGWAFPRTWCIDDSVIAPFTPKEKDFYTTDYFTRYALQYLEEYEDEEKPFFLYLSYTAPHDPLHAWPKDIAKYEGVYDVGYSRIRQERYRRQKEMGLVDERFLLSAASFDEWDSLSEEEKQEEARTMAVYAAMIDRVDQKIGEVLERIKEMGEADNTLILFASDNGASSEVVNMEDDYGEIGSLTRWTSQGGNWANVSNTPFRYFKNFSHMGGIASPLIAYWPGGIHEKGRIVHQAGHFIDFMPTFIELSGASYPSTQDGFDITPMEGKSLVPIFRNEEFDDERVLFNRWQKGKTVITPDWKMVTHRNGGDWELYNMRNDITETRDLSSENPEIMEELKKLYKEWDDRH